MTTLSLADVVAAEVKKLGGSDGDSKRDSS